MLVFVKGLVELFAGFMVLFIYGKTNEKLEDMEIFTLKKIISAALCLIMVFLFTGCEKADMSNVKIDYGTSSIYSEEDMDAAIEVIKKKFSSLEGCELHSLSYRSDEECNRVGNIAWMNDLGEANGNREIFTQCIAFDSSFCSPKEGGGGWEPNEEYTWSWWLARSEGGEWKLMTWGY